MKILLLSSINENIGQELELTWNLDGVLGVSGSSNAFCLRVICEIIS
jgi:hypothetical protein